MQLITYTWSNQICLLDGFIRDYLMKNMWFSSLVIYIISWHVYFSKKKLGDAEALLLRSKATAASINLISDALKKEGGKEVSWLIDASFYYGHTKSIFLRDNIYIAGRFNFLILIHLLGNDFRLQAFR